MPNMVENTGSIIMRRTKKARHRCWWHWHWRLSSRHLLHGYNIRTFSPWSQETFAVCTLLQGKTKPCAEICLKACLSLTAEAILHSNASEIYRPNSDKQSEAEQVPIKSDLGLREAGPFESRVAQTLLFVLYRISEYSSLNQSQYNIIKTRVDHHPLAPLIPTITQSTFIPGNFKYYSTRKCSFICRFIVFLPLTSVMVGRSAYI